MSRPKVAEYEKIFKAALHKSLARVDPVSKIKRANQMADRMVDEAIEGNMSAASLIMDRVDGKVAQSVGQDNELGPISVVVTGVPRAGDDEDE